MSDVSNLARTARDTRVVVIGGGIAGLVSAYQFARVGMPVTVLEASDRFGGAVDTVSVNGLVADAGAAGYSPAKAIGALVAELELADDVVTQRTARITTLTAKGVAPMPAGVLGIPANAFLTDSIAVTGWSGAWRAYMDRLRPVLTIGKEENLGKLVRTRMGQKVAERLVGPITRGAFGLSIDDVNVDKVLPGLNAALTRNGSLAGASGELAEAERPEQRSFPGGMRTLVDALLAKLVELDAELVTGASELQISRTDDGYSVSYAEQTDSEEDGEAAAAETQTIEATVVFVATGEAAARELSHGIVALPDADLWERPAITVTLAVADAGVPDIGAGLVTPLTEPVIWAIDDLGARWGGAPAGQRLLRVRVSPAAANSTDEAIADLAVSEAARVLGTTLTVTGSHVARLSAASPHSRMGHDARSAVVRKATATTGAFEIVGAWVAGSGVSRVVADAVEATEKTRRAVLFG